MSVSFLRVILVLNLIRENDRGVTLIGYSTKIIIKNIIHVIEKRVLFKRVSYYELVRSAESKRPPKMDGQKAEYPVKNKAH